MQRSGMLAALGKALVANLWRCELIPGTLLDARGSDPEQPQIIERAKALLGLLEQNRRITAHGVEQVRLHVPSVGDNDVIRLERINGRETAA